MTTREIWKSLKQVEPGEWYDTLEYKKEFSDLLLENGDILYYGWSNAGQFQECITGKGGQKIELKEGMKIRKSCYSI